MGAVSKFRKILFALFWLILSVLADRYLFLFQDIPVFRLFFVVAVIFWYRIGKPMIIPVLMLSLLSWYLIPGKSQAILDPGPFIFIFPFADLAGIFLAKSMILKISDKGNLSLFGLNVILRFFLLAAFIPSFLQVLILSGTLYLGIGSWPELPVFFTVLLSNFLPLVLISPIHNSRKQKTALFLVSPRLTEYLIISIILISGSFLIFSQVINTPVVNISLAYLLTPIFIWLSSRFQTREVSLLLGVTVLFSFVFSIRPGNSMITEIVPYPFLLLQIYFSVVLLLTWLIHILFLEREEKLNELTAREQDLSNIFENVPVPFLVVDHDLKILSFNSAFSGFFSRKGIPMKEHLYELLELYPDQKKANTILEKWEEDIRIKDERTSAEKEISMADSGGNILSLQLSIRPYISGYLVGISDITEDRQLLERIRKSERRLQNLVRNLQGMVFQSDYGRPGQLKFASEGCFRLTGYLPSEFTRDHGISFNSLISEDYLVIIRQKMEMAVKKGDFYEVQYPITTRSGEVKWVNEKGIGLYNSEGRLDSVEGIIVDISERMDILKSLRISEQRFRSLFDNIPVALWEMDFRKIKKFLNNLRETTPDLRDYFQNNREGINLLIKKIRILDLNQTALDFFRVRTKKEAQDRFRIYFEQGISDYFPEALLYLFKGNSHADNFYAEFSFEGRQKYVYLTWHILPEASVDWSRVVLSLIDVSKLREAQKEIIKLNEGLEEKVRRRTEELNQANKDLEAFSYSVSHDLKAPLRAIKGFGRMLAEKEKDGLSEKGQHFLRMITENVERMGELINALLKFSRLGGKSLEVREFNPEEMIREIWNELRDVHELSRADLSLNELPRIQADYTLIRQVFYNLLSNALKFSDETKNQRIEISCRMVNSSYEFCVSDNGIGFDQKFEEKIFKVFQRLHTTTEYEGTGIGLALVHRIVRLHQGKIFAHSTSGEGSKFYFTLPVEIHSE